MYIKKWANAPMFNDKMTQKYWSKYQIKGQSLNKFIHRFLFILVVSVKHWSAMLMLSKDCGTQEKEREREIE